MECCVDFEQAASRVYKKTGGLLAPPVRLFSGTIFYGKSRSNSEAMLPSIFQVASKQIPFSPKEELGAERIMGSEQFFHINYKDKKLNIH